MSRIRSGGTAVAGAGGSAAAGLVDYLISVSSLGVVQAAPRPGSGLAVLTGTASTVIQGAIDALTVPGGGRGTSGGRIHIARGFYHLAAELTITGWEGIQGTSGAPESQLVITGDGLSTQLIQNTAGKNGVVVRNLANFALTDLRIYTGATALSGLLLDSNGVDSEMSCWGSLIDNVAVVSSSPTAPAVLLRNFFDLSVPHLRAFNTSNHGMVIENASTGTHYGNSHFGLLTVLGSGSAPFAGLVLRTANGWSPNLMSFSNVQCNGSYYGIYTKGLTRSSFDFVDLEANQHCIYFDGTNGVAETRHVTVHDGYLLPRAGGSGVTSVQATGGNSVTAFIEGNVSAVPIADSSQYRPRNVYDIAVSDTAAAGRIAITEAATTPLRVRLVDGTVIQRLPTDSTVTTATAGDSSTKIATTAFVGAAVAAVGGGVDRRTAFWEAAGNSVSFHAFGLNLNAQGTGATRNVAATSAFTRARRIGWTSATTANARCGVIGNPQGVAGYYLSLRIVFGIATYNAAHGYSAGWTASDDPALLPSAQNTVLHMYADPGDTTWKIRGGGGTVGAPVDLGANFPVAANELYDLTFTIAAGATSATYTVKRLNTGHVATGTYTSIPVANTILAIKAIANVYASAVAAAIDTARVLMTTDY